MKNKLFDLTGKIAMVTGASRGLGEAVAVALAKAGASIAVCGRSRSDMDKVVARIDKAGGKARGFFLDVLNKSKVVESVCDIQEYFGQIDILVNNAGVNYRVPVLEFPEDEWDRIIDTNLKGYFLVTQAVVPRMLKTGYGKVINMSSILDRVGLPMQVAYASSKGGVKQMTKVMAIEWAKQGIQVNAISPTYFETELVAQVRNDPERFNFINTRTPMGRWGQLHEIEGIVIFLAASASDFITGQNIYIDGGWTAY